MTPVLFHFVTPDGTPLTNAAVSIQLSKSAYDEDHDGILMPRLVEATTDDEGKVTVELSPSDTLYYVECFDTDSDAALVYKFLVPEQEVPGATIRLQDIVIVGEMSNTSYDEAALIAIHAAKAAALTAASTAVSSAAAAAASAVIAGAAVDVITGHIADGSAAHAASAVSLVPTGSLPSTNVQAAVSFLDEFKANLAAAAFLGLVSAGAFAGPLTGDVTGNVSGNAGAVTNGVYTSGSYANPAWITSLAGSKVSGNIAGNAGSATILATARNINGVSFNGSENITVTAAAGTLTGNTLAAGVIASSLTSVGTLAALTVSGTSTLGVTRISGADASSPLFGISGTSKGIRFNFGSGSSSIESVDNTLVASFQPLLITGSNLSFYTSGANGLLFGTNGGTTQLALGHVASAVNRLTIQGGVTTQPVFLYADGSDAFVSLGYSLKGAGNHVFYTGSTSVVQAYIAHTAAAVNSLTLSGSATGQPTRIGNFGSDANPDILIAPQGTGVLRFGTLTASADAPVNGYITTKTAAGVTVKLATIA